MTFLWRWLYGLLPAFLLSAAAAETLPLPPRADQALSGSEFVEQITPMSWQERERAVLEQVRRGNVPDFFRNLVPVTVPATIDGRQRIALFHATPEYLCIGSDTDYFLCPLTPNMAQQIADELGCSLPSPKMVDAIYAAATVKLAPSPIAPSPAMTTVPVFKEHHDTVWSQRQAHLADRPLGHLVGGHKKDVVITSRLGNVTEKVAIYGWHRLNGTPIQPLYTGHVDWYVDYSHGIRLVPWRMTVDGQPATVARVLADPGSAGLLSTEGAFSSSRYPIAPATDFPYLDVFPSTGRTQTWTDRFTVASVTAFDPMDPLGDGYALRVRDARGGIETVSLGKAADSNYYVESRLYCHFRPELVEDGFERIGLFIRDDGNGLFDGRSSAGVPGNNYALTWDGHDGTIRCLKTIEGNSMELVEPVVMEGSGWRTFRIAAFETRLRFFIDDVLVGSVTDSTFSSGRFGIGYHESFNDNQNISGTYASLFRANRIDSVSDAMISVY